MNRNQAALLLASLMFITYAANLHFVLNEEKVHLRYNLRRRLFTLSMNEKDPEVREFLISAATGCTCCYKGFWDHYLPKNIRLKRENDKKKPAV